MTYERLSFEKAADHLVEQYEAILREKDAEIERLTKELDGQFEKWKILSEKTEKLYADLYQDAKQVVRAEAIDEFAERLYPLYKVLCVDEGDWRNEVDKIAKELKEGALNG